MHRVFYGEETQLPFIRGTTFLKKFWCCVDGRVSQGNLVLATELVAWTGIRKEFFAF